MKSRFCPAVGTCLLLALFACLCLTSGCVFVSGRGFLSGRTMPLEEQVVLGEGKDKILLLDVSGVISEKQRGGIFRLRPELSLVASVKEQLDKASRDDRVKGMVIKINSPGGTVTASDILYQEIKRFRMERSVKVAALFLDTAASGAYYVALAADRIVAHPTSVTGSIGVVLLNLNFNGLMAKIGVSDQTVKSGAFKDLGSPFREPQPGEKEILQAVVNDLHHRFCVLVEQNRKGIALAEHPELTDGRIFTASQALQAGLVDQIGYFSDAVEWIQREMGVPRARVIVYQRDDEYKPNIYAQWEGAGVPKSEINLIKLDLDGELEREGPTFCYLWQPDL